MNSKYPPYMKLLVQLRLNQNRGLLYYETKIYHIAIS